MSRIDKSIKTEIRLVVAWAGSRWEVLEAMAKECRVSFFLSFFLFFRVSFLGDKNVLKWTVVMAAQLCVCTLVYTIDCILSIGGLYGM